MYLIDVIVIKEEALNMAVPSTCIIAGHCPLNVFFFFFMVLKSWL